MKKIIYFFLLAFAISIFSTFGISHNRVEAADITINNSIEFGSTNSYYFKSSMVYDKYEVSYLLYVYGNDEYYTYSETINSKVSLRNQTIYNSIYFNKFVKDDSIDENEISSMEANALKVTIKLIKQNSCGFHNLESNCLVDMISKNIYITIPNPIITSPTNNYQTAENSIQLNAYDKFGISSYFYRHQNSAFYTEITNGRINDLKDGTYYWYAKNIYGVTSDIYTFTKVQQFEEDTTAPTLISPANNSTLTSKTIQLVATDNINISAYYYRTSAASSFTKLNGDVLSLEDNTTYYWYAIDTSSNQSETFTFNVKFPVEIVPDITAPTLISPANNAILTSLSVNLTAIDDIAVTSYYYKVSSSSTYSISTTGTINLSDNTTYNWYAVDEAGNKSNVYTFSVKLPDTTAPTLVSPANGYVSSSNSIKLVANDNVGVTSYYYKTNNDSDYISSSNGYLTYLEEGVTYYWYAVDEANNKSEVYTFTYLAKDTTAPTLIFPTNNSTLTTTSTNLIATDNVAIESYYLGIDGQIASKITSTSLSNLVNDTTYYWYAVDTSGNTSKYFYFTISIPAFEGVKLTYPANGERVNQYSFYLKAESSYGIKTYYYQLNNNSNNWSTSSNGMIIKLNYDCEYLWYAVDNNGNQSEVYSFIYDYNQPTANGIKLTNPTSDIYINTDNFSVRGEAEEGVNYFRYKKNDAKTYSTCINDEGYCLLRSLVNNDKIIVNLVDKKLNYSEYRTIYVDLENPISGTITSDSNSPLKVSITVGSDNFGATYYYRVNYGEWIKYSNTINLSYSSDGSYVIETKAIDLAGNQSSNIESFIIGTLLEVPEIVVNSGVVSKWTNQDIILTFNAKNSYNNYYCVDNNCYKFNETATITLSKDTNSIITTKTSMDDSTFYISEPVIVMIDKTIPVFGEVFYRQDRYNLNSEFEYIIVDTDTIVEENSYTIYYKFRNIDSKWLVYSNNRVPLYSYIISNSGEHYVDMKIVDVAGNESKIYTATILTDVEGPSININNKPTLYVEYEGDLAVNWKIKFLDLEDDYGYIYHVQFQMWDQEAYENNATSVINISEYTDESTTSYEYDITSLKNDTWYYLLYVCDNYINCTYSNLYTFVKTDNGPEINSGINQVSAKNNYDITEITIGLAALFVSIKKKFSI